MSDLQIIKNRASQEVVITDVNDRYFKWIKAGSALIVIFTCFSFMTVFSWIVFFERPILSYAYLPLKLASEKTEFRPGETVPMIVKRCSTHSHTITYKVTRQLKNVDTEITHIMPSTDVQLDPGCRESMSNLHVLPTTLSPGRYIIQGVAEVKGTLTTKFVKFYSEPFSVIK